MHRWLMSTTSPVLCARVCASVLCACVLCVCVSVCRVACWHRATAGALRDGALEAGCDGLVRRALCKVGSLAAAALGHPWPANSARAQLRLCSGLSSESVVEEAGNRHEFASRFFV